MRPVLALNTLDRSEALRTQGVAGAALQAEGWTMFVRQGLLAGGQACQPPASPGAIPRRPAPHSLPQILQPVVVQVRASMGLQLHREVGQGQ